MNLLEHLYALARPDLEALLVRQSGVASLVGSGDGGMVELAELLGDADQVGQTIERLNRLQLQTLELACLLGGTLTEEAAAEQGMPPGALAGAGAELAHFGLAFPREQGGLHVPPEVAISIANPGGLGPSLLTLMEKETAANLKLLARPLGVPTGLPKQALMTAIAERLGSPGTVRDLLEQASPATIETLDVIRRAGGVQQFPELAASLGPSANLGALYRIHHRELKPQDGLPWLWAHGLIFLSTWERIVIVPAEIELALRGRAFPTWQVALPELEVEPLRPARAPLEIVEEMTRAVSYLARGDLALLKSGTLGVRERRRIAAELGFDERRMDELLRLGSSANLLAVRTDTGKARRRGRSWSTPDESHFLIVTEKGHRWLSSAPAEAWLILLRGWLQVIARPLLLSDGSHTPPGAAVLDALASLPPDQATSPQALGRRLSWQHPVAWRSDEIATNAVATVGSWLDVLGIGAAPPPAGLTELGRAALAGAGVNEVRDLLPPSVARCLVQADLTVVVPGLPGPELAGGLARFAELQSSSAARVYRLTEPSLRRALDQGMKAVEIEEFLQEWSSGELPGTVLEMIRDTGRRHGRLRVGAASVYVASDDPALLAEVASSRKLRSLQVRSVSPTAAVIEGKSVDQVLTALRKAGFMPTPDQPAAPAPAARRSTPGVEDLIQRMPPMPHAHPEEYETLSAEDAAMLAERLLWVASRPATSRRSETERERRQRVARRLRRRYLDQREDEGEDDEAEILYLFREPESG